MKKIISIISVACVALLAGCEKTVTLDGGVDQRITAVINSYIETLASAENGWFADVMTKEGNYRFYMDFTADNYVTMYTDNLRYKEEYYKVSETSTYNIRSLQRPVISFDTYTLIHLINDPDDEISGGADNKGLETDFEFEVDSLGKDGIFYLTGRINRVEARLTPATAEEAAKVKEGALMDILDLAGDYLKGQYKEFTVGATPVLAYLGQRIAYFTFVEGGKPLVKSSFIRTQIGGRIDLITPFKIEGKEITAVDYDPETEVYSAVVAGDEIAIEPGTAPIVPLPDIYGPWKQYRFISASIDMFDSTDRTKNELGYLFAQDDAAVRDGISVGGNPAYLWRVQAQIYESDLGQIRFKLIYMLAQQGSTSGSGIPITYPLTYTNDDKTEFSIGNPKIEGDGGLIRDVAPFMLNYFKGKTFRIDMGTDIYGNNLMGQIKMVKGGSNPAVFYGALEE